MSGSRWHCAVWATAGFKDTEGGTKEAGGGHGVRKFTRVCKLEEVKLVRKRGVPVAQEALDLGVHGNVLRRWARACAADLQQAFLGQGQMKPDQLELERLRREVTKLKTERDIQKSRGLLREGGAVMCEFIVTRRGSWPTAW